MVLRQDLENTVCSEQAAYRPTTGRWCVRAVSINYTVLASGHWRTTPAGDLFIAEIPRFAVVERQKYFRFSLP